MLPSLRASAWSHGVSLHAGQPDRHGPKRAPRTRREVHRKDARARESRSPSRNEGCSVSDRKPIPGWPEYEIDRQGNVFRVAKTFGATPGKKLKWQVTKFGYALVSLCRNSRRTCMLVHRLVAMTFLGDIPRNMDVCHFDGNKLNNCAENLRIDTRANNVADNVRLDRHNRGERSGSNKYKETHIKNIKRRLISGEMVSTISMETGIPKPTLYAIRSGQTWGWLDAT